MVSKVSYEGVTGTHRMRNKGASEIKLCTGSQDLVSIF